MMMVIEIRCDSDQDDGDLIIDWEQVRAMDRLQEVPHEGPLCDLLWFIMKILI